MKQDSMVVEYRGDLLRPKMSDDRQKLYNRIGKDCYLFNVNDDVVIDATMTGAVGRFTVWPCPLPALHESRLHDLLTDDLLLLPDSQVSLHAWLPCLAINAFYVGRCLTICLRYGHPSCTMSQHTQFFSIVCLLRNESICCCS